MFRILLVMLLLSSPLVAGDPTKDLKGPLSEFLRAETMLVKYNKTDYSNDYQEARDVCTKAGFVFLEDDLVNEWIFFRLAPSTDRALLEKLVSDRSIKFIKPNFIREYPPD